ncbi:hypothetical protein BJX76DRAFT_355834 [Aspergillus varians]
MQAQEYGEHLQRQKLGYGRHENGPDDHRVAEYYNLIPAGGKRTKKQWATTSDMPVKLTKYIDKKWRELEKHSLFKNPDDIFIRPRVDMLLDCATKEATTNSRRGQKRDGHSPVTNYTKHYGIEMANLTSKRMLSMPFMSKGRQYQLTGQVDYVLFSGDPEDLDAALIVLRAARRGRAQVWSLLKLMAMIHHARKTAGKDPEIYGIATDSSEWAFAHIDSKSRYSCWFLEWRYNGFEIVAHVMRILDYAGARAAAAVRAIPGGRTTSKLTGCRIYRPEEVIYSKLEESGNDGLDYDENVLHVI